MVLRRRNPVGYHVGFRWTADAQPDREIVGVVCDSRTMNLRWRASPQVFVPYPQRDLGQMVVHVRTSRISAQIFRAIREQVRQVDSRIPVVDLRTMEDHLDRVLAHERLVGFFSILFGVLATILATVGLYAVTAYSVGAGCRKLGFAWPSERSAGTC